MIKKLLVVSVVVSFVSCSGLSSDKNEPINNEISSTLSDSNSIVLDKSLGEKLYPDELNVTNQIEKALISSLEKEYPLGTTVKRDAHGKHHGCVKATFKVTNTSLNSSLKTGVFSENNKEFKSWIRFSNGRSKNDTEADVRGMAIKLMGVEGQKILSEESNEKTQDFLMINNSTMFINDLNDYVDLTNAISSGGIAKFALMHPKIAYNIYKATSKKVDNPLSTDYFSTTPYKLGNNAIKFKVKPCSTVQSKSSDKSPDFLRNALSSSLNKAESCFDFMIQTRKGSYTDMPIEDSLVDWSPEVSPFITVAKITIPKQSFETKEQMDFCENLSYTPWHSLPEQKPLGSLNRVRKQVYTAISKYRHNKNNQPRKEPTE